MKVKEDELRRFAELIQSSDSRKQMMQRINGFRVGLINRHGTDSKRVTAFNELIDAYN
jgi:hypothetical protein